MSANEYARQRGREASPSPQPSPLKGEGARLPRPIGERAQARAAENRDLVRAHLPEALPFIKELHELGMIDGWRNVESVELLTESEKGERP